MNRRTFLSAGAAALAVPFIPSLENLTLNPEYLRVAKTLQYTSTELGHLKAYYYVSHLYSPGKSLPLAVTFSPRRLRDLKKGDKFVELTPENGPTFEGDKWKVWTCLEDPYYDQQNKTWGVVVDTA